MPRMPTAAPVATDPAFDHLLEQVARRLRALGEPGRLRIVCALSGGEMSVAGLAAALALPRATLSRQLAVLHEAGVTQRRRVGANVVYRVADQTLLGLCRGVADGVAAMQAHGAGGAGTAGPATKAARRLFTAGAAKVAATPRAARPD